MYSFIVCDDLFWVFFEIEDLLLIVRVSKFMLCEVMFVFDEFVRIRVGFSF